MVREVEEALRMEEQRRHNSIEGRVPTIDPSSLAIEQVTSVGLVPSALVI
jgi:hypothetical protein